MIVQELINKLEALQAGSAEVKIWTWRPEEFERLEVNTDESGSVWLEPGD